MPDRQRVTGLSEGILFPVKDHILFVPDIDPPHRYGSYGQQEPVKKEKKRAIIPGNSPSCQRESVHPTPTIPKTISNSVPKQESPFAQGVIVR